MVVINAFLSGILFLIYQFLDNWFWIFALIIFVVISVVENRQVESDYVDDKRRIV